MSCFDIFRVKVFSLCAVDVVQFADTNRAFFAEEIVLRVFSAPTQQLQKR